MDNSLDSRDIKLLAPFRHEDSRGFFAETYSWKKYLEHGIDVTFVQDNHSLSRVTGTLRGLHFQGPPHSQAKLVRCLKGSIWDVVVDLRKESQTFGKHVAVELSSENKKQLLVPRGFAHGFVVLSEQAIFSYKVDKYYQPGSDRGIAFNDSILGIDWKLNSDVLKLSEKDLDLPLFNEAENFNYATNLYE